MDLNAMAASMGLEPDEFREIVELFISTAESDMDRMQAARAAEDATLGSEAAHSLKGSAGNLGFADIADMAARAEQECGKGNLSIIGEVLPSIKSALVRIQGEM